MLISRGLDPRGHGTLLGAMVTWQDELTLSEDQLDSEPHRQFALWLREAVDAGEPMANAMALATVGADGMPAQNSSNSWSRRGDRPSRECAIVIRSTFTRRSSGRYVIVSAYCIARG